MWLESHSSYLFVILINNCEIIMATKAQERKAKAEVALKLRKQEEETQRFKTLNMKIKKKEQLSKEELQQFNDITKNTRMEKVLQTNEYIIDTMIREKFEDQMYYDIFVARCRDIGEAMTGNESITAVEKAKYFKDEVNLLNKGNSSSIICFSMKLGNMAIGALCKHAKSRKVAES